MVVYDCFYKRASPRIMCTNFVIKEKTLWTAVIGLICICVIKIYKGIAVEIAIRIAGDVVETQTLISKTRKYI